MADYSDAYAPQKNPLPLSEYELEALAEAFRHAQERIETLTQKKYDAEAELQEVINQLIKAQQKADALRKYQK